MSILPRSPRNARTQMAASARSPTHNARSYVFDSSARACARVWRAAGGVLLPELAHASLDNTAHTEKGRRAAPIAAPQRSSRPGTANGPRGRAKAGRSLAREHAFDARAPSLLFASPPRASAHTRGTLHTETRRRSAAAGVGGALRLRVRACVRAGGAGRAPAPVVSFARTSRAAPLSARRMRGQAHGWGDSQWGASARVGALGREAQSARGGRVVAKRGARSRRARAVRA